MKKTKLIALTMAVAIMLMGAGYAIWSDQVFLTTTVQTGDFNVEIEPKFLSLRTGDNELQNEEQAIKNDNWGFHDYDWTNGKIIKSDANEAVIQFTDLYPGGSVQVDLGMVNKGSIPAKLKSIDVTFLDGNRSLFNKLTAITSWKADRDGDGKQDEVNGWAHVDNWKKVYNIQDAMNALVASTETNKVVIEPGGWLKLGDGEEQGCIVFKLDPNVGNNYQKESCKFKLTFNWEQWSTDPSANPYHGQNGYGGDGEIKGIWAPKETVEP